MEKTPSSEDQILEKEVWIKCKSENWLYETLGRLWGKKKTPLIAATFIQATTSLVTSQVRQAILPV